MFHTLIIQYTISTMLMRLSPVKRPMVPPTTPSRSEKLALTSFSIIIIVGSSIWMVSLTTSFSYLDLVKVGRLNSR